jgi:hypothetical protein
MQRGRFDRWMPTETAAMLWMIVVAMLLGWLVVIVVGHPVALTP